MLTSLALIFLTGLLFGAMLQKLKLPPLLGMIFAGILLGPYALNLLDGSIITVSAALRQLALVIILTRAGLSLDIADLKKVGRPAVLMCFLPACFEILGVLILAPVLFGVSILEAALMGSVLAAVSPAVVVPRMIKIMEEGYGKKHSIPQLILAGASVDDVFVIVLFTALLSLSVGDQVSISSFLQIPVSILLGVVVGAVTGWLLVRFFKRFHMRDSIKVLILLSASFLLLEVQNRLEGVVPISGLLAIMSAGIALYQWYPALAERLASKYNKLWVAAQVLLFVLVGATVNLAYVRQNGVLVFVVVLGALIFRMMGVWVCLIKTPLTPKERFFCMVAYTPKATVQAGIGAIPFAMGLSCGQLVLSLAVMSILITAPFGAIGIDRLYPKLLEKHSVR